MRYYLLGLLILGIVSVAAPNAAQAADDENARLREMLHRTQEALHQAQSDNADLGRAKLDAEQKLQDASKQLDSAKSASKAVQSSKASLQAQVQAAQTTQTNLQHSLDDANNRLMATDSKLADMTKQLAARDAQLKDITLSLGQSKTANASCEAKNVALFGYAQQALQLYKKKGVWASLSQKEPVLGLKEVDVENVVQEYQLKFDAQKVKP
jgi:DNA repair exonuclease SbcCD ATPase subunit